MCVGFPDGGAARPHFRWMAPARNSTWCVLNTLSRECLDESQEAANETLQRRDGPRLVPARELIEVAGIDPGVPRLELSLVTAV